MVDKGQQRHSVLQLHIPIHSKKQYTVQTPISFFSNFCYSTSSMGSNQIDLPSLPLYTSEHWALRTKCILETPTKTCHFWDALTQLSSHHNLTRVKVAFGHTHFSCFYHQLQELTFVGQLLCARMYKFSDSLFQPFIGSEGFGPVLIISGIIYPPTVSTTAETTTLIPT